MSFVRSVRLRVPAGSAKPGPAIGQALGPLGINMAQFCKDFNERSQEVYVKDTPLGVELRAMSDRSYTFQIRSPPTSYLIQQAIGMTKGPNNPNMISNPSGAITPEMIYEIARMKQLDDNRWHIPLDSIARSVVGTARSMGVQLRELKEDEAIMQRGSSGDEGGTTDDSGAGGAKNKKKAKKK